MTRLVNWLLRPVRAKRTSSIKIELIGDTSNSRRCYNPIRIRSTAPIKNFRIAWRLWYLGHPTIYIEQSCSKLLRLLLSAVRQFSQQVCIRTYIRTVKLLVPPKRQWAFATKSSSRSKCGEIVRPPHSKTRLYYGVFSSIYPAASTRNYTRRTVCWSSPLKRRLSLWAFSSLSSHYVVLHAGRRTRRLHFRGDEVVLPYTDWESRTPHIPNVRSLYRRSNDCCPDAEW